MYSRWHRKGIWRHGGESGFENEGLVLAIGGKPVEIACSGTGCVTLAAEFRHCGTIISVR